MPTLRVVLNKDVILHYSPPVPSTTVMAEHQVLCGAKGVAWDATEDHITCKKCKELLGINEEHI